ncbi:hypothetical protein GCM10027586_04440 [Kineococcus gypseus]|uniref:vWA domain-containing protein n=1 Tax=Kineococcus gypseus TaxID=1637102 RepID=UPI003D7E58F5
MSRQRTRDARLNRPVGKDWLGRVAWCAVPVLLGSALVLADPPGQPPSARPGEPVSADVTITAPSIPGLLDLLIALDVSNSYAPSLPAVRTQVGDLVQEITASRASLALALSGFADAVATEDDPRSGYQPVLPFGTPTAREVDEAVGRLRGADGGDIPEQMNEAVLRLLEQNGALLREDAQRILIIATDAPSRPDGPATREVLEVLKAYDVHVVALVPDDAEATDAQALAKATGGSVQEVERDGSGLTEAVLAGVGTLPQTVVPQLQPGCPLQDVTLNPPLRNRVEGGSAVDVRVSGRIAEAAVPGYHQCRLTSGGTGTSFTVRVLP